MPVSGEFTFEIPEGRVYVPRSVLFYPSRTYTTIGSTGNVILPVTVSMFIAGVAVPEMTNIDLTLSSEGSEFPLHFIAGAEGNIRFLLSAESPASQIFDVAVTLYGNSILSTDRPINQEISTVQPRRLDNSGNQVFPREGQS